MADNRGAARSRPVSGPHDWGLHLRWAGIRLRNLLGIAARMDSPDRVLLEQRILPAYARRPEIRRVLFIGVDWYTMHYRRYFAAATDFRTLDVDPRQARFGARRHICDAAQHVDRHFAPGSLDLVICNGVFGWGLDAADATREAFAACLRCLRPGGEMLLGWNDVAAHAPFDPSTVALAVGFEKCDLAPLGCWRTQVPMPTRHTYEAYVRPAPGA